MAHLLLHKCYIHIVFSVTETEKKKRIQLLTAGFLMCIDNTLNFDMGTNRSSTNNADWRQKWRAHPLEH